MSFIIDKATVDKSFMLLRIVYQNCYQQYDTKLLMFRPKDVDFRYKAGWISAGNGHKDTDKSNELVGPAQDNASFFNRRS